MNPASNPYRGHIVRRALIFATGCVSLVWAAYVLPQSETADSFRELESRLLRFESFSRETATQQLQSGASAELNSCDTHSQTALLLLEMPLAESALRSGAANVFDQHVKSLETRARRILSCAPRESFVWLVAFDLELLHGLLNEHAFNLLAMSYDTSSNEAWISVRRIDVALPLLPLAPESLQKQISTEFQQLIRNGFVAAAARSYLTVSGPVQALLQSKIEQLDVKAQKTFSDAVGSHPG